MSAYQSSQFHGFRASVLARRRRNYWFNVCRVSIGRFFLAGALAILTASGCATRNGTTDRNSIAKQRPESVNRPAFVVAPATNGFASGFKDVVETVSISARRVQPEYELVNEEQMAEDEPQLSADVPRELQSSEVSGITLKEIEQLALQTNPAIRQQQAGSAKAGGIRTQVGLKPNPTIGYFGEEIGNDEAGGLHGGFISQTFVRGDKLQWNKQVLNHDVNQLNWQTETQRQRVLTDVRMAFYEALAAQKRLELARDFRTVAENGVKISKQRLDATVGSRPDVLQTEIQLSEVRLSIQQAEYEFAASLSELASLAGVADLGDVTLVGEFESMQPDRDSNAEFNKIISGSPELAAAKARVDRARANLQRQRVQAVPNVIGQIGTGTDDTTGDAFANIQVSLPIPVHNKNQGNITAAHAEYCAAIQNVERIRMSIRQRLARSMREYRVANATVDQYQNSILPKATESLKLIQQAQQAGEYSFLRVLTARRDYFNANLKYVTALGKLAQANAKIEGMLLTGGLSAINEFDGGDDLRGQALNGQ